ncbi:MAG: hypothetical protein N3D85_02390 [Candidatus Bathyarchaeota archaeon]|nr:hypothetical protein [Candidatus Bathyarchaeota archaeon]
MADYPYGSLKIGLFVVTISWFLFTAYEFLKGAFNIGKEYGFWISLTDTAGAFGLGFRTAAALIAVVTTLFFVLKRDLTKPELYMSIRWMLLGEIVCFLALFPCVIWGLLILAGTNISMLGLGFFTESTLPVMIESIGIPIVLAKLFFELNPNKPAKGAIKWALIGGTFYLFVHWINNTGNWVGAITRRGIEYVTAYPDHILSAGLTTVGLLVLAIYSAYFSKKSIGANSLAELDLRKVGVIITALGLYFLIIYVMWLFLGTNEKWSTWYAWFLGHNMDLWLMSLPLVGVPLLFKEK